MVQQLATLGVTIETASAKKAMAEFGKLTKAAATLETHIQSLGKAFATTGAQLDLLAGGAGLAAANLKGVKRAMTPAAVAAASLGANIGQTSKKSRQLSQDILTVGAAANQMGTRMGASDGRVKAFGHIVRATGGAVSQMGVQMHSASRQVRAFNEIFTVGAAHRGIATSVLDNTRRVKMFGDTVTVMGGATRAAATSADLARGRIRAFGDDLLAIGNATREIGTGMAGSTSRVRAFGEAIRASGAATLGAASGAVAATGRVRAFGEALQVAGATASNTGQMVDHTRRRFFQIGDSITTVGAATSQMGAQMGDVSRQVRQMGGAMSEAAVVADHTRRNLRRAQEGSIAVGAAAAEIGASMGHSTRQVRAFGEAFNVTGGATRGFSLAADHGRGRMHLLADGMSRSTSAIGQFGTMSRKAEREFSEFTRKSTSHADGFMGVVLRLAAVFGGIQLSLAGLRTIANFEDIRDSFTSLNQGNPALGEAQFAFARRYARQSPQTLEEVASAIVGLQNNNIQPSQSLLRLFSDVASVTSDQRGAFAQAVKLWQRGQQGGLGVEELDILSNRGVDVYGAINRRLGLTRREVGDMGQDAAGSLRIVKALEAEWRELYGGASIRRIDNLSVKWNAFVDTLKEGADNVGKGLKTSLHDALDKTSDFIQRNAAGFESLGAAIGVVVGGFSQLMTLASDFNRLTFSLPLYGLGAIMALFATSGIMKVLRLISPVGFIGKSSTSLFKTSQNLVRGARELYTGRNAYAGYTMMGLEGALAARSAADLASSRRGALQGIAADARVDPNINRRISRNLSSANKFGMVLGGILTSYRQLIPLMGKATLLVSNPAGVATATVGAGIGLAVVKVREDMQMLNENVIGSKDTPESLIGRSFTFGEVWRGHVSLIKEDLVGAFQDVGWAIDDALGNVPTRFWSWLNGSGRSDAERARLVAESYGQGYTQEGVFHQYGSGPWDPRFDPLNAPPPHTVESLTRLLGSTLKGISQDPEYWKTASLSNAGSVLVGGREPQINIVRGRQAKIENDLIQRGRKAAERFREEEYKHYFDGNMDAETARQHRLMGEFRQTQHDYYFGADSGSSDSERFADEIGREMGSAFRTITGKGQEAIHDMVDSLGRELNAQVLEHTFGEPFRKLLQNLMTTIYDMITDPSWWQGGEKGSFRSGVNSLKGAFSNFWASGQVPSADSGGYTGFMGGPGVDGKGGRPWILHNDEWVVPGKSMRRGGGNVTLVVNGVDDPSSVRKEHSIGPDGDEIITLTLNSVVDDIEHNGPVGQAIQNVFGADRVARA